MLTDLNRKLKVGVSFLVFFFLGGGGGDACKVVLFAE